MNKVELSDTGTKVSSLCLGTMHFGSRYDDHLSYELLDAYVESGASFLDTANIYSKRGENRFIGGESEELLSRWLKDRHNRSDIFLATKVGFQYEGVEYGTSAGQIKDECDKCLKRLCVDTIDLLYLHTDDRNTPLEESLEALNSLREAGKVRFVGASNFAAWRLEEACKICEKNSWKGFCCVQQRYSYLKPRAGSSFGMQLAANDDLLDYCKNRPIRMLAYSPLLNGAYSRSDREFPEQYRSEDNDRRIEILKEISADLNVTENQLVLAWMMQSTPAVVPLISGSSVDMLKENTDSVNIEISEEQMERLTTLRWS